MTNYVDLLLNNLIGQENDQADEQVSDFIVNEERGYTFTGFYDWEWPQGVALYGLANLYKKTSDQKYVQQLEQWHVRNFEMEVPFNVNSCAPMLSLACLYEFTGEQKYLDKCEIWLDYVLNKLGRTNDNGFQHDVREGPNTQELWDDTLMMTCLFVARMGIIKKDQTLIDLVKYQFVTHAKYLFDKKTGLWFHGWSFIENGNFAEALWCRGNSWITIFIPELIDLIGNEDIVFYNYAQEIFVNQVQNLAELQNVNGLWHTLLDDPTSYVESSGTAGIAYGIAKAININFIDKKYQSTIDAAYKGLAANIKENGDVENVSYGTPMGKTKQFYKEVPLATMPYGQSLTLMFMSEYK